jgi:Domain of unknown function (DUF4505)
MPKNIASSIKDEKFLNFFFSRIRLPREADITFLALEGLEDDYPYVSYCGKEINYIRPAATPVVFHTMMDGHLYFGGSLKQAFRPIDLAVSLPTGRLYHRVESNHTATASEYGLIRSSVAVALSEQIHAADENDTELTFVADGEVSQIQILPANLEPGHWGLGQIGEAQ